MHLVGRKTSILLFAAVLAILIGYVLIPAMQVFVEGAKPSNLTAIFSSWRSANVRALVNSVAISLYSVIGAGVVGTLLAYFFYRYDFPLKRVLMAVAALPLALPPLVGVLAFLFLYGESGILPRALQVILGLQAVPFSFDGLWAVWVVHVYTLYVYFYLFVGSALRGMDGTLLEASAGLGATGTRTFLRVVLPVLQPAIVGASLLVFMVSMASFTAPLLFAGNDHFLTLQIFNYKTNGNLNLSAAVSTVLTVICVAFLFVIEATARRRPVRSASKGVGITTSRITGRIAKAAAVACATILLGLILLPVATIVLVSFAQEGSWTLEILPSRYTLDNYASLFRDPEVMRPILNSLRMAAIATIGNLIFGVAAAVVITKGRTPGKLALRILSALPFAIPGTVIAVNLIVTFNRSSVLSFGEILVGSFWILPLAYFVRNIPFIVRSTAAALENVDDTLTEASANLGAGGPITFYRVVLPLILPGIVAGTLLTFVTALGEFVASIMLYVFSNRPISVEILAQLRLFDFGGAAAYSVLLMILVLTSTMAARFINRGRGRYSEAFI